LPLARLLSTDIEGPSHFITGQCPIELLRGRDLPVNCAAAGALPTRAYTSQVLSILILSLRDDDCQFRHSIGQSPRWSSTVGYFPTSGVHGGGEFRVDAAVVHEAVANVPRDDWNAKRTNSIGSRRSSPLQGRCRFHRQHSQPWRSAVMLHRQTGHSLPTEMPPGRSLSLPSSCWYRAPPSDNPRGVSSLSTRIGGGALVSACPQRLGPISDVERPDLNPVY
jgi:hypothetical protein